MAYVRRHVHSILLHLSLIPLAICLFILLPNRGPWEHDVARSLRLGVSALRISLPVFLALEEGLFRRHGLDVQLRVYDTAQPMIDDLVLDRLDAAGFAAYPIVFLASQRARRPLRLVTSLIEDRQHRISYGLTRRGSGLRFPRDARGKKIGILPTVAYRRWLQAILESNGLDSQTVTVIPVEPPLQAQTLASGAVDFLFTNDPMATAMIQRGVADIADDGPPCATHLRDPFPFGTFVLSGALSEDRTDVAQRIVAALDEAIVRTNTDPTAARRAMAKYLRPEERAWVEYYPPSRYLTSSETSASTLTEEIDRERALGILERRPNVRSWSR